MTTEFWMRFGAVVAVLLGVLGFCRCVHYVAAAYLTTRLVRNARGHEDWLTVRTALRRGR